MDDWTAQSCTRLQHMIRHGYILSIYGSEAKAIRIDPFRKLILSEDKFSVKERDGKLLVTNVKGKIFVFARALDEKKSGLP